MGGFTRRRALDPGGRLRAPRRAGGGGPGGRRANDPRRRHGRPLRPADHDGPARRRGARRPGPRRRRRDRRAPDDRAPRAPGRRSSRRPGPTASPIHVEATPHVHYALQAVRDAGCRAGLALCPATPVAAVSEVVGDVDLVLCMTVNPGWGGQEFLPQLAGEDRAPARAARARARRSRSTAASTPRPPGRAPPPGATLFVAGTSVFGATDPGRPSGALERPSTARRSRCGQPYASAHRARETITPWRTPCSSSTTIRRSGRRADPAGGRGLQRHRRGGRRRHGGDRDLPAAPRGRAARRPAARHRRLPRRRGASPRSRTRRR